MALIECPECGREVSSSAAACPACAYPLATGRPALHHAAVGTHPRSDWLRPGLSIVARIGVGFLLLLAAADGDAMGPAAVVGGLIIGGSAIPTYFRAWKDRLLRERPNPMLSDGLADRILDMEHTHREQMAELEERIDFAERLLTKQREE